MTPTPDIVTHLQQRFGEAALTPQPTCDGVATAWTTREQFREVLAYLRGPCPQPFSLLYDLTAVDERLRTHRPPAASDFTVVYHLLSFDRNQDLRLKVALKGESPSLPTITDLWPNANWYEREAWDMFGVRFEGHPCLRRILLPPWWQGHALRKEHPARATEMGPFTMPPDVEDAMAEALAFKPEQWGLPPANENTEHMFLNLGPNHPGTHGVLRVILQLEEEEVKDAILDIGFHHRGAEKMGERQTWHTYLPYTDRVDYLGGVMNNLAYCLSVEAMAGIVVPDRAQVIRVMLSEFFRISSHLVFLGTFTADIGFMTPVFYLFSDRERIFDIVQAITGGRMHPSWFRLGGTAHDLPAGWDTMVREFLDHMPPRIDEFEKAILHNAILKARTKGIGAVTRSEAVEWGFTGPNLRATGLAWDLRKKRPYSGYQHFEFDVPTAEGGDCFDRGLLRVQEMRQSLRIIRQCLDNMPAGPHKADHPLACPPPKARTLLDIDTLIHHFLGVTWGPVIPPGEAGVSIEGTKGLNTYYLTSDGGTTSYRTRIRTPSFAHLQAIPMMARGLMVADLIAILGSIDFILADTDR